MFLSDEIWKRKQLRTDLQWKPRDAITGALPKSTTRTEATPPIAESVVPLDQSASVAFDEYIKRSTERAKIEAERALINQHILEQSNVQKPSAEKQASKVVGDVTLEVQSGILNKRFSF